MNQMEYFEDGADGADWWQAECLVERELWELEHQGLGEALERYCEALENLRG